jgi:biofilm PGA synthesis protein PgaD
VRTLWGYGLLALANAALLVGWAIYNHRRFGGKDRRKPIKPLSDHRLAKSFAVTPAQLAQLRAARVSVIHHGAEGEILDIEKSQPRLHSVQAG